MIKEPDPELAGKCYKKTFQLMQDAGGEGDELLPILKALCVDFNQFNIEEDLKLVHGNVELPSGRIIGHAWIEIQDRFVYDPVAFRVPQPKDRFYEYSRCGHHPMQKVSRSEMARLLQLENDHVWADLSRNDIEQRIADLRPEDYTCRNFLEE